MPTNPKWVEHTERAAWDTVRTLREKLEQERARIAKLSPVRESWVRMIDRLDATRDRHSLRADAYVDLLDEICTRLDEAARAHHHDEQTREPPPGEQIVEVVPLLPPIARDRSDDFDDEVDGYAERVHQRVEDLESTQRTTKGREIERLVARAEMLLEELEDAEGDEAMDLAVEVGALAMAVARRRRSRRRR